MFHMKRFISKTQKIGEYGEKICAKWLIKNGYILLDRNYSLRKGEIDIIAQKDCTIHFIEVKSSTYKPETDVSYETYYNPAENVTRIKIQKCYRVIYEYKRRNKVTHETQFDVYVIYIDKNNKHHKIKRLENVLLV